MAVAIKFLLVHLAASLAHSHFLPIKEDPADALADKLIKGAGIDSSEMPLSPADVGGVKNWKTPALPYASESSEAAVPHTRLGSRDLVRLQPIVSARGLDTPEAWETTPDKAAAQSLPETQEPVQSVLMNDNKMLNQKNEELLHELVTRRHSHGEASEWEEPQSLHTAEVDQELEEMAPKEVVKVSRHETVVHTNPGLAHLAHLGKSVDDYGPVSQEPAFDPTFSLHHGHYHPTTTRTVSAAKVAAPAVAAATASLAPVPATAAVAPVVSAAAASVAKKTTSAPEDDLASSLKAHIAEEKTKELSAEGKQPEVLPQKNEAPAYVPSAMKSVHRSPRASPRFPIAPEDIHQVTAQASSTSTDADDHPETSQPQPKTNGIKPPEKTVQARWEKKREAEDSEQQEEERRPSMPSATDELDDLFNANSVDGLLTADDVEQVWRKMNVQQDWNWHPFDLNGDGELSHMEFLNAAHVAKRFKVHKK